MVDCERDFFPLDIFLESVDVGILANDVINVDGLGRHFVTFYEPGIHKTYNFTLKNIEQSYPTTCGEITYAMEIVDTYNFEEAFQQY